MKNILLFNLLNLNLLRGKNLLFIGKNHRNRYLYCVECGYMHPDNAGLEEGDICPVCGRGIFIEI